MTNTRSIAGRKAKKDGHNFEHSVSLLLQEKFNIDVEVDGKPGTKVDLRGGDNRYSVKKTPDDLQVGLITQQNFIDAMDIKDNEIITFIGEFFGGDHLTNYSR